MIPTWARLRYVLGESCRAIAGVAVISGVALSSAWIIVALLDTDLVCRVSALVAFPCLIALAVAYFDNPTS